MKSWKYRRFSLLLAGWLIATAASTAAAQENETPLHAFFAPLEVPLVSIDVYVSDRDGQPVPGLRLEDFEVFEDGRPVDISHFYAAPEVAAAGDEEEAAEEGGETAAADKPDQGIYLVIFFDDTNLQRGRRQAALDHVRGFLESELPPKLKVMLVRYDGHLRVEQGFTDHLDEVSRALDTMSGSASLSREIDETRMLRELEGALATAALSGQKSVDIISTSGSSLLQDIETYVDQTVQRVRLGIEEQKRFIRSLSGLSGRKAILMVSDGVEQRVGERLYRAWAQAFGSAPEFRVDAQRAFLNAARNDVGKDFDELAREANAHRISLYTLSGAGIGASPSVSAQNRLMDESGLALQQAISSDVVMASMAGATGGRTLVNSPALAEQLDEVAVELASYYSLAFEPTHNGDGKYHKLEVRLARDGAKVRHREGYLDLPASERLNDRTLAAAVHGVADNPLGISLQTGQTLERDDGTLLVPILITVPIGELVLVPGEEEHRGQVSILLAVRDANGVLAPTQLRQYPIPVPNLDLPTALNQSAGFTLRLAVRPGRQRIAVGLRDDVASTESVATLDIDVTTADS